MRKATLHIYLGDEKRKQVQHAAVELGVTTSELVRCAIKLFLETGNECAKQKLINKHVKEYENGKATKIS